MIDSERLDLPSASKFDIVVLCPGQPNLFAAVGNLIEPEKEEPDEDALSGQRIHKARETLDTSELSEEERKKYNDGLKYEKRIFDAWVAEIGYLDAVEGPRELRLWLNDPATMEPASSGQLDVHYIARPYLLIVDWKTGYSWNLTPSHRNWQLRKQAVLAAREYDGIEKVRVAFDKPIATADRIDVTDYTREDLEQAEKDIFFHLWKSKQIDAQRTPGVHCRYCPCKPFCPEAAAWSLLPSVMVNDISPEGMVQAVERMTPADWRMLWSKAGVIVKILDAAKECLKRLPTEQLTLLSLQMTPGKNLNPIVQTKEAFYALKEFGITEGELWSALSFSKGELVKAVRRDKGWKEEETERWLFQQILAPMIEIKKSAGSLKNLKQ